MRTPPGILWDFDGTLARRSGLWSDLLIETLDVELAGHGHQASAFRAGVSRGFPWHDWERPHPGPASADAWWASVTELLRTALLGAGVDPALASRAAERARAEYLRIDRWQLYPDTVATLDRLAAKGWRHAILSNHVPELSDLIGSLGIADRFHAVLSSALTGYEKPHAEAFALGRAALGNPDLLWMVGDNPVADIEGARRAGIPGILVRRALPDGSVSDLSEVIAALTGDSARSQTQPGFERTA